MSILLGNLYLYYPDCFARDPWAILAKDSLSRYGSIGHPIKLIGGPVICLGTAFNWVSVTGQFTQFGLTVH